MSKVSKRIAEAISRTRQSPAAIVERVKVRFAMALEQRRRAAGISYSELASRIETSPAYVTKLFRGDSNLTIETMVKLAVATGSDLDIQLVEAGSASRVWDVSKFAAAKLRPCNMAATASTATVYSFPAANDHWPRGELAA